MIKSNCHIIKNGRSLADITFNTLENDILINNHIILCGLSYNLHKFFIPLRQKQLKSYPVIVILHEKPPSLDLWMKLKYFPQIYFVKGSAMNPKDLKKVKILHASKVVLLEDSLEELKSITSEK